VTPTPEAIAQTRAELGATLDTLEEKLRPAERAAEAVADPVKTAGAAWEAVAGAVRRRPWAAVAGLGLLWLVRRWRRRKGR